MVAPDLDQLRLTTREALLSRTLSHPHLVQTYAITLTQLSAADLDPETYAPRRPAPVAVAAGAPPLAASAADHQGQATCVAAASLLAAGGGVAVDLLCDQGENTSSQNLSALIATALQSLVAVTEECVLPPPHPETSGPLSRSSSLPVHRSRQSALSLQQASHTPVARSGGTAAAARRRSHGNLSHASAAGSGGGGGSTSTAAGPQQAAAAVAHKTTAELPTASSACAEQAAVAGSKRGLLLPTGYGAVVSPQLTAAALLGGGPRRTQLQRCDVSLSSFALPLETPAAVAVLAGDSPVTPRDLGAVFESGIRAAATAADMFDSSRRSGGGGGSVGGVAAGQQRCALLAVLQQQQQAQQLQQLQEAPSPLLADERERAVSLLPRSHSLDGAAAAADTQAAAHRHPGHPSSAHRGPHNEAAAQQLQPGRGGQGPQQQVHRGGSGRLMSSLTSAPLRSAAAAADEAHRNALLSLLRELRLLGAAPGHFLTCVIMEYCERGNLLQLIQEQAAAAVAAVAAAAQLPPPELASMSAAGAAGVAGTGTFVGVTSAPTGASRMLFLTSGGRGSRHRRSLLPQVASLSCNTSAPVTGNAARSGAWASVAGAVSGPSLRMTVAAAAGLNATCGMGSAAAGEYAGSQQGAQCVTSNSFGRTTTETLLMSARGSREGNPATRQSASVAAAGLDSLTSVWELSGSSLRTATVAHPHQHQHQPSLMQQQLGPMQQAAAAGAAAGGWRHRHPSAEVSSRSLVLLRTALEIAQAMSYLHSLDLVHGDLKPANVLLRAAPAEDDDDGVTCAAASLDPPPPTPAASMASSSHTAYVGTAVMSAPAAGGAAVDRLMPSPPAVRGGMRPPAASVDNVSAHDGPFSSQRGGGGHFWGSDAGGLQPLKLPQPERRRRYICKLADFGLTNCVAATEQQQRLQTPAGVAGPAGTHTAGPSGGGGGGGLADCGAVPYLAPEIVVQGTGGKPADVYSYGALLWHMCSGVPPHSQLHPAQILVGLAGGELQLEWPADAEPTLRKIGAACLQHDPAARPSFDRIVRALIKAVEKTVARSRSRPFATPAGATAAAAAASNLPSAAHPAKTAMPLSGRIAQSQAALPSQTNEWQEVSMLRPRPQSQRAFTPQALAQALSFRASVDSRLDSRLATGGDDSVPAASAGPATLSAVAAASRVAAAAAAGAAPPPRDSGLGQRAAGSFAPSPAPHRGLVPAMYRQWIPPEAFLISTGGRDSSKDHDDVGAGLSSSSAALALLLQSGRYTIVGAGGGGGIAGGSFEAGSLSSAAAAAISSEREQPPGGLSPNPGMQYSLGIRPVRLTASGDDGTEMLTGCGDGI
ncbi:hypothetical protein CHLRE_09g391356v5 [Chlamydomonas reinhardtii]|nr:uncharacterized protein CHLRE_09g391356v5 [Chlamydomonas reinhardtii]PNW78825.1 hypothetical protein CHLRE_09g391356v5 [Chlamydomonas reinhardtii]